jgi:hypothetical protein
MKRYVTAGVLLAGAAAAMIAAPPAGAECTTTGGVTICAQGSVSGQSNVPSSSGPYYPYPCEDDWLCDDGGLSVIVDPGPPGGGIDIGRPGRPR